MQFLWIAEPSYSTTYACNDCTLLTQLLHYAIIIWSLNSSYYKKRRRGKRLLLCPSNYKILLRIKTLHHIYVSLPIFLYFFFPDKVTVSPQILSAGNEGRNWALRSSRGKKLSRAIMFLVKGWGWTIKQEVWEISVLS